MAITPRLVGKAKRLLRDDAWKGDHGFTGEALKAWDVQKEYLLAGLIFVVTTKRKRVPRDMACRVPDCPRAVSGGMERGTMEGSIWRNSAAEVIFKAYMR